MLTFQFKSIYARKQETQQLCHSCNYHGAPIKTSQCQQITVIYDLVGSTFSLQPYRQALYNDSNQTAYKVVAYLVISSVITCLGPLGFISVDTEMAPEYAAQCTASYTKQKWSSRESSVWKTIQEAHGLGNCVPSI